MKEVVTFLRFDGNCRAAMEFYKKCFAADLFFLTYSEAPADIPRIPEAKDRIMHATLTAGSSTLLMAADTLPGTPFQREGFAVMLHCESLAEIERLFAALGENGSVTMPLQDTFWNARFGMLTDRFGIPWSFNFAYPPKA